MSETIVLQAIPLLVTALRLTIQITIAAFVLGQVLALPIGVARTSRRRLIAWPCFAYTFAVRGSPLLVQLFLVYYGLGQIAAIRSSVLWPVLREPVNCAILVIGLNSAAYSAEIIRGALLGLPKGQTEAATALGLGRLATLARVSLPQVYRIILPVIGNEIILVLKASALASTVTVMEMTGAARSLVASTYVPFEVFSIAGVLYLAAGLG